MYKYIIYFISLLFFSCACIAKVISPENGAVFEVGETVTVELEPESSGETVSAFFFHDRDQTLFGGPVNTGIFTFIVDEAAINPYGDHSELVIVYRKKRYLQSVDTVSVTIVS